MILFPFTNSIISRFIVFFDIGLHLSLSSLKGKVVGGVISKNELGILSYVVSIVKIQVGRYCVGIVISQFSILSAAYCIRPYEKAPKFGGVYIAFGKKVASSILHMESHPDYNRTGQNDFDIGLITVSKSKIK